MKYLFILLLSFLYVYTSAQVKNGVYKSTERSFRQNYLLVIEGKKITYYGWEINLTNDTFYYRSFASLDKSQYLFFEKFDFSRQKFATGKTIQFIPDSNIMLEPFLLHRYLANIKQTKEGIALMATKDIYDSRADEFYFKKIY
jgi:hypothetical protein